MPNDLARSYINGKGLYNFMQRDVGDCDSHLSVKGRNTATFSIGLEKHVSIEVAALWIAKLRSGAQTPTIYKDIASRLRPKQHSQSLQASRLLTL